MDAERPAMPAPMMRAVGGGEGGGGVEPILVGKGGVEGW